MYNLPLKSGSHVIKKTVSFSESPLKMIMSLLFINTEKQFD